MRKRKLMKYAGMYVIKLIPQDIEDLFLQEGDEIDIDSLVILNKPLKPKGRKKTK